MSKFWVAFLKSKTKFRLGRIAAFGLLIACNASIPRAANAQSTGVAEYARQSAKMDKKASKQYRKAMKKNAKAQRKAAKKQKRQGKHKK